ncbi:MULTISPECIES: hypothetical protein [Streptomyces]|uniref:Uncharacterized protein n=1 Tax=Streptomyces stelliscabiei TaxID=146820 RepID=A0A8I0TV90_9ACTN|nr:MULTISPECIES: hypothetical protein [Streptomyces]KFG09472.1 hypothetical protein IQ61_08110 [Streptomyces scabiei]KND44802.1 hypothetical protein IQ64_10855 [Streptomyces stelliscabiei]MBE1601597.1 hypothetical protein [Streptomyces stelliscabiei]MDX2515091.1 hypothetical protein [Streptomyces stelliscabiei]MDX2539397.1 hypothetical protein [Streptomyces scabiei]
MAADAGARPRADASRGQEAVCRQQLSSSFTAYVQPLQDQLQQTPRRPVGHQTVAELAQHGMVELGIG